MWDKVKISQLPEVFSIVSKDYLVVNENDQVSSKLSYQNFLDTLTSENLIWTGNLVFQGNVTLPEGAETDPLFTASPAFTITQEDIDRWNEAHSWGDHSLEGYLKAGDIPTGFLMPGDNVSLLFNDPPYVTKSELDTIIDGLDFVTLDELNIIIDGKGYLKPGDPVSLLDNDVPYLTEISLRCILDGYTAGCNPDPSSRGYLKRAVDGVPQDKVSELENDVPYLTEADFINVSREFLWRRDADGNFRDDNIELANGMGYLEHTWDGAPLIDYNIEILSNVNADGAVDGEVLIKEGDSWVNGSPNASLGRLYWAGAVDVGGSFPTVTYKPGAVVVQHHYSEGDRVAQPGWLMINPPDGRVVPEGTFMIYLLSEQWVVCGKWNEQLQSDWLQEDSWEPSFIRNKPTKLSDIDDTLPDHIGDGKIEVSGGDGIKVTGNGGTANQQDDTDQTIEVDLKTDGGIIIDGGQISIDWDKYVGDGDINLIGGTGIIVRHTQVEEPHANQFCDTDTVIEMAAPFVGAISGLVEIGIENLVIFNAMEDRIAAIGNIMVFKGIRDFVSEGIPEDAVIGDVWGVLESGPPDSAYGLMDDVTVGQLYGLGYNGWALVGNTDIDLSIFATKSESEQVRIDTHNRLQPLESDPVTKNYVDLIDDALGARLSPLESDPVTKNYVNDIKDDTDDRLDAIEAQAPNYLSVDENNKVTSSFRIASAVNTDTYISFVNNELGLYNLRRAGQARHHAVTQGYADDRDADTLQAAKDYADGGFMPLGSIIFWAGLESKIPAGWQVCDGSTLPTKVQEFTGRTNTPNLKNFMPAGGGGVFGAVGETHSSKIKSHSHLWGSPSDRRGYPASSDDTSDGTNAKQSYWRGNKYDEDNADTSTTGDSITAPPVYCGIYIMKVS